MNENQKEVRQGDPDDLFGDNPLGIFEREVKPICKFIDEGEKREEECYENMKEYCIKILKDELGDEDIKTCKIPATERFSCAIDTDCGGNPVQSIKCVKGLKNDFL